MGAEIQITQPNVWKVRLESDKIYDKWRNVDLPNLSPQEQSEYQADFEMSNEM